MAGLGLETIKKAWRLVRRVAFRPKIVPFTGVKKKKKKKGGKKEEIIIRANIGSYQFSARFGIKAPRLRSNVE